MTQTLCESCQKPIDAENPDLLKGEHYICLDCQVEILNQSLMTASEKKAAADDLARRWEQHYDAMRRRQESQGETPAAEVIEASERYRARLQAVADREAWERSTIPPGWSKRSFSEYFGWGFLVAVIAAVVEPTTLPFSVIWWVLFLWGADRFPRKTWTSRTGWIAFVSLWWFGGIAIWAVVRSTYPAIISIYWG